MDLELVKVILQAVSASAIAGSLIYAAVQFKSWRQAQFVANYTKLVELQMQQRRMRVENPDLARVYKHDIQTLATDKEIRDYFLNLMQLSIFELVWFSHREGQLPDDYYRSWVKRMQAIEREESFQKMINNPSMKFMHDEFHEHLLDLMRTAGITPRK
jgi:hypothetical protein